MMEPDETAECPYCHRMFRAPARHDPLRKHLDYCEARQEGGEIDDDTLGATRGDTEAHEQA